MPRVPGLSSSDLVRALERLEFQKVRQTGSHVVTHRNTSGCIVPNHSELKVGTVSAHMLTT